MSFQEKNSKIQILLNGEGLPNYAEISPENINEEIPKLLEILNEQLIELEKKISEKLHKEKALSWKDVMPRLYDIEERMRWSWGAISHLNGVSNTESLRAAYSKQQPGIIRFQNQIGQSQIIYNALKYINDDGKANLNNTQKRILNSKLVSMEQLGIGLNEKTQKEFNNTSERIANLSTTYSNNVLDSTQKWSLLINDPEEIKGLPEHALGLLAEAAKKAGDLTENGEKPTAKNGPWRLGLDMPKYHAYMTYGENRTIREKIYKAFVSRASEGELNNQPLIKEILQLKLEQANRLGYSSWANLSLTTKMARDVKEVEILLEELRSASYPKAQEELKELQVFAQKSSSLAIEDFSPWDLNFWSEKLLKEKFDLNQEALRPWFPMPQVLDGLFNLCQRLFGITIEKADGEAPIWHKDVRFFKVFNLNGSHLASFYLDPYSRPENKRGGAWMDECVNRKKKKDGTIVLPIAYLVCNQSPPIGETPSLMSFEEVETLFHEFGHGLQHMLTTVDYPQAAGINNVEWDAVELPSQFMENWCRDRKTLIGIAKHWKTKEALPEEEFNKLIKSHTFNSGLSTLRQVHLALTDLKLHSEWHKDLGLSPDEIRRSISRTTSVFTPIKEDNFLCCFNHIFSGGYAAGYYSYKWAEVLSADAFAAFEEAGLDQPDKIKETGKLFRETILSLGGSLSPGEIYKAFRGRSPNTSALIRHYGLKQVSL